MNIDLELNKVIMVIKAENAQKVCIQLPDGLKPRADEIQKEIIDKTGADVVIWAGSCFGACDYPDLDKNDIDMLIQWGHSKFTKAGDSK